MALVRPHAQPGAVWQVSVRVRVRVVLVVAAIQPPVQRVLGLVANDERFGAVKSSKVCSVLAAVTVAEWSLSWHHAGTAAPVPAAGGRGHACAARPDNA